MIDTTIPARVLAIAILAIGSASAAGNFSVRDHGAIGDGRALETAAIQKAIDAAASAKGGTVVFPPGRYLSGTIRLRSHVKLHLDKGATLLGSTNLAHYQRLNFLALIMGNDLDEIGISGEGVIDGQGKPIADSVIGPIKPGKYPDAGESKRPVILNFRNCRGVAVRDVTLRESACWVQLYRDCDRVTIENITVRTLAAFTNDGLDIDGCSNVIIRGCDIDSQDDGICLKSTAGNVRKRPDRNCRVRSSCNALKFGTASFKGFRNITVRDLEIYDTYLSAIALECVDGGVMENVNISNVRITDTNNPLFIRLGHRNTKAPPGK
jgi:parallel beta-helix repeat protein